MVICNIRRGVNVKLEWDTIKRSDAIQALIDCEDIKGYPYVTMEKALMEIPSACKSCSNHPSNGGSGICHCTLGTPVIT